MAHSAPPNEALPGSAGAPARPVISPLRPNVDEGRRALKAFLDGTLEFRVDIICDGHDLLICELRHRPEGERRWSRTPLQPLGNDAYATELCFSRLGRHEVVVHAAVDHFASWRRDAAIKAAAGEELSLELLTGAALARQAAGRARGGDRRRLMELTEPFACREPAHEDLLGEELAALCSRYPDPSQAVSSASFPVQVERRLAAAGNWYELFPRSCSDEEGVHGTFRDVIGRLDYLEQLGVDVLYLPPVHPIGTTKRKGRNGRSECEKGDPGSPWAIGSALGGHTAIHPELGSLEDFAALVQAAGERGIEIALDLAFQCSPDHPWCRAHPQWFRRRADGSIRHAENPPKHYQDIYPIDFESRDWRNLWKALHEVVTFWVAQGVHVFRVDNPHTKPFAFWEWLIRAVQRDEPRVIFLAEAFTRPKVMAELAKLGFSQSYTYFTWRQRKEELEGYFSELADPEVAAYFRPNLWPNTPDILTEELQHGGRAAFAKRALLAATLSSNWGLYGPAFESLEHEPREAGSEEYRDSEKYELRHWPFDASAGVAPLVARLNALRHAEAALGAGSTLAFLPIDNPELLAYVRRPPGGVPAPILLVIVNLDARYAQSGWVQLDAAALGLPSSLTVVDLLSEVSYRWESGANFVILDPDDQPGHLLALAVGAELPR